MNIKFFENTIEFRGKFVPSVNIRSFQNNLSLTYQILKHFGCNEGCSSASGEGDGPPVIGVHDREEEDADDESEHGNDHEIEHATVDVVLDHLLMEGCLDVRTRH